MDIFGKMTGGLFIIIVLIWLCSYLYTRVMGGGQRGAADIVRVVTSTPLGARKFIAVVNVADDFLVIGVTNDRITCLSKIEDPAAVERLRSTDESGGGGAVKKAIRRGGSRYSLGFKEFLKKG
ncbi:MAG: flagellar biosynthetic protein FliO [Deltaproteobacteria bacterium]|nr:flagellar biosynthetic protein FliO [Deltaproteobacteria bacterium]